MDSRARKAHQGRKTILRHKLLHLPEVCALFFERRQMAFPFTLPLSPILFVCTFRCLETLSLSFCRPACPSSLFHTWETLLQEVEADSQAHSDVASALNRQVSRPLVERSFHRKLQSRKVFAHREGYEAIITKTEETLTKVRLITFAI